MDTESEMITVSQQMIIVDRRPVLAPPKTHTSVRDVPMPLFLKSAIERHVDEFVLKGSAVLCRTPRQALLRRDYYNREIWKPALVAAGLLPDTTFHDYADVCVMPTRAGESLAAGLPARFMSA